MSEAVDSCDVLVIGAGLFGAAVARECALRGLAVLIVERDEVASGASRVGQVLLGDGLTTGGDAGNLAGLAALAPHLVSIVPVQGAGLGSVVDITRLTQLYVIDAVARGAGLLLGVAAVGVEDAKRDDSLRTVVLEDDRRLEARAVVMATGAFAPPVPNAEAPSKKSVRIVDVDSPPESSSRIAGGVLAFSTQTGTRLLLPTDGPEHVRRALEVLGLTNASITASDVVEIAVAGNARGDAAPGLALISESAPGAHRPVATYLADVFARAAGRDLATLPRDAPLPGGEALVQAAPLAEHWGVSQLSIRGLVSRHGSRAVEVMERTERAPEERALSCPCESVLECEVRHACRVEEARSLADVSRRTRIGRGACHGLDCVHRAAQIVGEETGAEPARSNGAAWAFLSERFRGRAPFLGVKELAREELMLSRLSVAGLADPSEDET